MENPIQMDALGKFLYGPGHSPISGLAFWTASPFPTHVWKSFLLRHRRRLGWGLGQGVDCRWHTRIFQSFSARQVGLVHLPKVNRYVISRFVYKVEMVRDHRTWVARAHSKSAGPSSLLTYDKSISLTTTPLRDCYFWWFSVPRASSFHSKAVEPMAWLCWLLLRMVDAWGIG